ncbi:uncharacterized protein Dana_GF27333 [Drosophila ananassae]|uniref:Uncharacterized protein n=1 Tax=Drosophila ananassae TaxID=7217 RepID=A0A0P8ZFG3_DROAN|nr:uncharacterized protein LOC26514742 [Drosophila ananassae]KPU73507.1 uncharacterized protein Dana_GF27333 [Drosophila ananassae]
MSFIKGFKKFATTTVGLMAIGLGSTALLYTVNRIFIQPHLNQKRRLQAEACAEYLFQQESQHPVATSSSIRSE